MAERAQGWCARQLVAAAAAMLLLTACSSGPRDDPAPTSTSSGDTRSSPSSSPLEPRESATLYTLTRPPSGSGGGTGSANAAVLSFAEAIGSGERREVDAAIHAPTPEDPSVIDQTLRAFVGVEWDHDSLRWTDTGVLGPCYLLRGEAKGESVHLSGTAVWNDAEREWEFTTSGFPGSVDYPELPTC